MEVGGRLTKARVTKRKAEAILKNRYSSKRSKAWARRTLSKRNWAIKRANNARIAMIKSKIAQDIAKIIRKYLK